MTIRRFIGQNSGAAAVEFGLVSIFFIMILFGIEEVARFIAAKQDLMSAVHSAGRYAIVHGSSSSTPASATTLQQMVANNTQIISSAAVTANASFSPNNSPGSTVTITASYTWTSLVSLPNLPSTTITATSTATILN
jgi:Flp pilus assembly protein TadG